MANWSTTTKHEPSSINNGRRYELRDRVSIEQLNNMTENSFYAMEASSVAKEKAEEALKFAQGSGTTVYENGSPVAEFNADKKVDKTKLEQDYYTKQEVDDKLANLDVDIDFSDYYTKNETNSLLSGKADKTDLDNYVTESELDSGLANVDSGLRTELVKKANTSDLESLAGEVGRVSSNLSTVTNKYLKSVFVTNDGKTLQIYDQDNKATLFEGGGGNKEDTNLSQLRTKILWTNPNPLASFASQTITLNSSDYDYLLFISDLYQSSSVSAQRNKVSMTIKGRGCSLNIAADYGGAEATFYRTATYINDTQYNISGGSYRSNTTTGNDNSILVPIQVIGLKKQPAMIYTGAELYEGDGIKIENGVISSVQTVETLLSVSNPSSNTTKTISNISPYKTLVLLAHQTGNAYFGMSIPVSVFKMMTGGSQRIVLSTDSKYFVVYYVNDTTIGLADVASGLDKFVVYGVK